MIIENGLLCVSLRELNEEGFLPEALLIDVVATAKYLVDRYNQENNSEFKYVGFEDLSEGMLRIRVE